MRILMIHPNWKAYSEVWLHRMINLLEDEVVGIACFSPLENFWENKIPTFDLNKKDQQLPIRYHRVKRLLNYSVNTTQNAFLDFVNRIKPDRILVNFIGPALYLKDYLDRLHLPVFIHVHGVDVFWEATDDVSNNAIHGIDYQKRVLELQRSEYDVHFIANSLFSKQQLIKIGIPDNKVCLKYFGIHLIPLNREFNRENLQVLFLGRFVDFKGPDTVLKAFLRACEKGFSGTLKMVGSGLLVHECQQIAKSSIYADRIFFKDAVSASEATALFKEADIFSMHSCWGKSSKQAEAFGVVFIEAMSHGVPVITGEYGGPSEIIENGYNGILIEPNNVEAHAEAFITLQNNRNLMRVISENSLLTVKEKYSPQHELESLRQILALYD